MPESYRMASYLKDTERLDSLPSIRRSTAWEATPGRRIPVDAEIRGGDRNVRFHTTYHRYEEPSYVPRPPSPTRECHRRYISDYGQNGYQVQDQVGFYREEIAKKDRLIAQLTSMPDTPRGKMFDTAKVEEFYCPDRFTESICLKSETAGMKVKLESLQSQIRDLEVQLEARDEKIRELKLHVEAAREGEAKQVALVSSLKQTIFEYEKQYGCIEGAANRSEFAISTLQNDNKILQERIIELESRTKDLIEEKERAIGDRHVTERQLNELIAKINCSFNIDITSGFSGENLSDIAARISDLIHENTSLRTKFQSMREHMESAELEHKASRETILRLVSDAEKEQKSSTKYYAEVEVIRREKEEARARLHDAQREIELLKERLDAANRSWQTTRKELEERERIYTDHNSKLRDHELAVRNAESSFKGFKQMLADFLSDGVVVVEPFEECIRDRVKWLTHAVKDKSTHIDLLEGKVRDLTSQLEAQCDLHKTADSKSRRMERDFLGLEERLRRAESEISAGEALRDGFRIDKERYMKFLEQISHSMKMDALTIEMGIDGCTDAILARADQLVKHEYDAITDKKTQVYNLQRKLKTMKEQLDSKELHMEMMRKKMVTLEERLVGRTELEREKDEDIVKNRKLVKLVEKYKAELNEARLEIRDLKAQLLESSEIRARTIETEHLLEEMENKVGQLERVREKQSKRLGEMKESLQITEGKLGEKSATSSNTIQALSSELRTTKSALEDVTNRERQLLDLRAVTARMLGLDVNTLAVPDYEIISRLEKLILANQANASTAIALDTALDDMQDGFRTGYEDATRALTATSAVKSQIQKSVRTRSRSMSPKRKRDTRQY